MGVGTLIHRAVFLDRDGVLNRAFVINGTPHPPATIEELEILPGVRDALKALAACGFKLIVVTNQPDVARGTQTRKMVETINAALHEALPELNDILVCYHDDIDRCLCRKPKPGLLLQAAADYAIDTGRSFMIGDRWSDVAAGRAAGCVTFLIDMPYSQRARCDPHFIAEDLPDAARQICALIIQEAPDE